jgi:hypothetical protein
MTAPTQLAMTTEAAAAALLAKAADAAELEARAMAAAEASVNWAVGMARVSGDSGAISPTWGGL